MRVVNEAGIALIKNFEGLRLKAYQDVVGVWTIGYGHTSMAGEPAVTRGLAFTRQRAEMVLRSDVANFAAQVQRLVPDHLNDNQFAALVSFAYNVGLGNFRQSSVLKAVLAGDDDVVPRRLALWNRAGGRVLSGLIRRRASEGEFYVKAPQGMSHFMAAIAQPTPSELSELQTVRGSMDVPEGKSFTASTTVWSALTTGVAGVTAVIREAQYVFYDVKGFVPENLVVPIFLGVLVAIGVAWIIRERMAKSRDEAV